MDGDATLAGRKRSLPDVEAAGDAQTPTSFKKRKLDDVGGGSPSTPTALTAIASAISGVFGYGRQPQSQPNSSNPTYAPTATTGGNVTAPAAASNAVPSTNGVLPPKPAAPAVTKRPAIKLAALKGTIWDNGNLPASKKGMVPNRSTGSNTAPQRGRPASTTTTKPSDDDNASPQKTQAPKGILTPTKKRGRPRKNVTFNRGLDGEIFFEDLPKTPSAKKSRTTKAQKAQQAFDGIVCEICSKPDSKAPNEIILCDNCDFAVHQQCYDIAEIPQGDWLCKTCSQDDVLKTPSKPTDTGTKPNEPAAPVEVPDIPNLDQHVRAFQRVLLDRCSGRQRIRIFGQEEPYEKARQLVEQTVLAGEGNSMLVIGPRGSGKTTVR